ncbi:hypothetical protein ENSA7_71850 [Enhygromyxa salina]|uniref:Nucleotidyltransferase n=1 Tax=Enhygromyxa salina TaxID=215803 RepID=A0A2S9XUG2_9BACT|nr:hypothetical protein ENSA7_71850 [Enhygromyxa salina]
MHAEPRSTNDVDFIAALRPAHASALARSLEADFYIDEATALDAILNHRSFNLIDEQTFVKIDVFVPPPGPLGADQLRRRVKVAVAFHQQRHGLQALLGLGWRLLPHHDQLLSAQRESSSAPSSSSGIQ